MVDDEETVARVALQRSGAGTSCDERKRDRDDSSPRRAQPREQRPIGICGGRPGARRFVDDRTAQQRSGPVVVLEQSEASRLAEEEVLGPGGAFCLDVKPAADDVGAGGGLSSYKCLDELTLGVVLVVEEEDPLGLRGP